MKNALLILALIVSVKMSSDFAQAGVVNQTAHDCVLNGYGASNATLMQGTMLHAHGEYGDGTLVYLQIPMAEWSASPDADGSKSIKKIPVFFKNENGTPAHMNTAEVIQEVTGSDVHLTLLKGASQGRVWIKLNPDLKTIKFVDLRLKGSGGAADNHLVCDF